MSEVVLYTVLRIHLILMQIFLTKQNFQIFSFIFMLKFDEPLRNQEIFMISLLSLVLIWVQSKIFSFSFSLIFCGSESVDPHILRI